MNGNKNNCLICDKEIVYQSESKNLQCYYCGKDFASLSACADGHYVCDNCHSAGAFEIIKDYCSNTVLKNPVTMLLDLMKHPSVKMHGPEHHFMVPAVLLAAYYNASGKPENKAEKLSEAEKRSKNIPGGFCGFYGNCGAGVGTGIYTSLILGATPLSGPEWMHANRMTALSLLSIADHGGPRCCKRNSFLAIEKAADYTRKEFKVELEMPSQISCGFSALNKECTGRNCLYFPSVNKN